MNVRNVRNWNALIKKKKKYKIKIKRKWYIDILQQTRILFKLRTGMINVRNNVKNKYVET